MKKKSFCLEYIIYDITVWDKNWHCWSVTYSLILRLRDTCSQDRFFKGPEENNFLKGNVKLGYFLDLLLYSDPKQLFHNISITKKTSVHYQGNLEMQWQHQNYFFTLVPMKNE
jgi:hypothetical protein